MRPHIPRSQLCIVDTCETAPSLVTVRINSKTILNTERILFHINIIRRSSPLSSLLLLIIIIIIIIIIL